jgi:hypothetical protein
MVSEKIKELEQQKASLERHVQRIQAEAEKGIAYKMFQKIDGPMATALSLKSLLSLK